MVSDLGSETFVYRTWQLVPLVPVLWFEVPEELQTQTQNAENELTFGESVVLKARVGVTQASR